MKNAKKHAKSRLPHAKLRISLFLLMIFSFWNFLYNSFSLLSCYLTSISRYYPAILALFFTAFIAFLAIFSWKRLQKANKIQLLFIKIHQEKAIAGIFLFVVIFQSLILTISIDFPDKKDEYVLSFLTIMILTDYMMILIEKRALRLILAIILIIIWSVLLLKDSGFEDELAFIRKFIQILMNSSMIVYFLIKRKADLKSSQKPEFINEKHEIKEKSDRTLIGNKSLFRFLNSLNSGILLYDKEMQLLFYNRKMRGFLYKSTSSFKEEELNSNREAMSQYLHKIKNIKCYFPEEKTFRNPGQEEINSSLKSIINTLTQISNTPGLLPQEPPFSFKSLLNMIKNIANDSIHPLYNALTDHHLIFHYILNNSLKSQASIDKSIENTNINMSFISNPQIKYNEIRVSRIEFEGDFHLLFEFINETERKKTSELNNLNEHKNKILSHVAHEFRTPLNSIIGNLELLEEFKEIPNLIRDDYLKPALFSSTLLLNYVNDILDFAQMKAQKLKLNYVRFHLPNHIETISKIMEILAKKKKVLFKKHIDPNLPLYITSDPNRLSQILLNLLSNAFKFTIKEGIVELKVTYDEELLAFRFEIADNGIGISSENIKKLFKEFGKVDSQENCLLNPCGVGLGLLISQKFAEEMGPIGINGFEVKSEIGKGTNFSFYLEDKIGQISANFDDTSKNMTIKSNSSSNEVEMPKEIESLERKTKNFENFQARNLEAKSCFNPKSNNLENTEDLISLNNFNNNENKRKPMNSLSLFPTILDSSCFPLNRCICPTILVVDDDMFNVSYLQNVLKLLGYSSDFAINGEDALKKVKLRFERKCYEKCKAFKMIFMDSEMPNLDGLKATEFIKKLPHCGKIVIVGCTGNYQKEDIKKFIKAGADMVCGKPMKKTKIMDVLEKYRTILG